VCVAVSVLNLLADSGDLEAFLLLSEHPQRRDVGEVLGRLLFDAAPFQSLEQIQQVQGIGHKTTRAICAGLQLNLERAGLGAEGIPTLADLNRAVEGLRKQAR